VVELVPIGDRGTPFLLVLEANQLLAVIMVQAFILYLKAWIISPFLEIQAVLLHQGYGHQRYVSFSLLSVFHLQVFPCCMIKFDDRRWVGQIPDTPMMLAGD